jgi:hypothetical protein
LGISASTRHNPERGIMCEFMEDGNSVFNRDLVMKALDPKVKPLDFTGIGTWP